MCIHMRLTGYLKNFYQRQSIFTNWAQSRATEQGEGGGTGARCPPPPLLIENKKMCTFFIGCVPFLILNGQ